MTFNLRHNLQFNTIYKGRLEDGRFIFFKYENSPNSTHVVVLELIQGWKNAIRTSFSFEFYMGMRDPEFLQNGLKGLHKLTERERVKLGLRGFI